MARGPGKLPGKISTAAQAAKTLSDPNASAGEKGVGVAAVGAEVAVTAIGSAVGSPVLGKVAGAATGVVVRSKTGRKVLAGAAAALVVFLIIVIIGVASTVQAASMLFVTTAEEPAPDTSQCGLGFGTDGTLTAEQQANATAILTTVTGRGLGAGDAVIAIMTALTESTLNNVDHGDLAGPDSRGLFQQRDSWGTLAVRMDPAGATGLFLDRLTAPALKLYRTQMLVNETIDSRGAHPPWLAAQSVQISAFADGSNYKAQYPRAVAIVAAMLGADQMPDAHTERWADQFTFPLATGNADPNSAAAEDCPLPPSGTGPGAWGGYSNGLIPLEAMCPIPWAPSQPLRCDATAAMVRMNIAFKATFGYDFAVTDGYRSYAQQVATKAAKGSFAATPGTSNHGWGMALDFGSSINTDGSPQHIWMEQNAPRFGWINPPWAVDFNPNNGQHEPWHWEFQGEAPPT